MPHYKCVACKTRLYSAAGPLDLVGDLCPQCGSLLEPAGELAELVGFRLIKPRDSAPALDRVDTRQWVADRLDEFLSRRETRLTQAPLDALRWADDGGSFRADAVARPENRT